MIAVKLAFFGPHDRIATKIALSRTRADCILQGCPKGKPTILQQ